MSFLACLDCVLVEMLLSDICSMDINLKKYMIIYWNAIDRVIFT